MKIPNYIYLSLQLIACIFALIYWRKYKQSSLWIFWPFLIYTFLNEIFATYLALNFKIRILYNLYIIVSFLVYLYWFDKLLKLKFWKWIIMFLFCFVVFYDIQDKGIIKPLLKTAVNFETAIVLILSVVFFMKLLRKDEVIEYYKLPEFWVVSGLLMFYLGFVPLSLIVGMGYKIEDLYIISIIFLNFLLYCGYIIGFYVSGKR